MVPRPGQATQVQAVDAKLFQVDNREARALYESCGYKQDDVFVVYKQEP